MGVGGGDLAMHHNSAKTATTRGEGSGNRGNVPDLMCRGYVPRGKRREAGCYSTSRGLPKALQIVPGKLAPADFSHRELTGNPVGKWVSKLVLMG